MTPNWFHLHMHIKTHIYVQQWEIHVSVSIANSHEAFLARNTKRIAQYHNLPSYYNKSLTSIKYFDKVGKFKLWILWRVSEIENMSAVATELKVSDMYKARK